MDRNSPLAGRGQKRKLSLQDNAKEMAEWPPKKPRSVLFPEAHGSNLPLEWVAANAASGGAVREGSGNVSVSVYSGIAEEIH